MDEPRRGASRRLWRAHAVRDILAEQGGVASREQLRERGITRWDVRAEVQAKRWVEQGRQSVQVGPADDAVARRWSAVFEVGAGARIDGVSALLHAGLTGWTHPTIDVSVPHGQGGRRRVPGVRVKQVCQPSEPLAGLPRERPVIAAIRAASWASSDRQAATILAMVVQQRLVSRSRLAEAASMVRQIDRAPLIRRIIGEVCGGAESLGEIDFAVLCRAYQLPEPERQARRVTDLGRHYLDVRWRGGLVVEINGAGHFSGLAPIDDDLRQNAVTLLGDAVLRISVLGLRLREHEFMSQVAAGLGVPLRQPSRGARRDV